MAKASNKQEPATKSVDASKVEEKTAAPEAWSYEVPKDSPFFIGGKQVARLTVEPVTFSRFVKILNDAAAARARDKGDKPSKYFLRERLKAQLRAWDKDGTPLAIDDASVMMMPIKVASAARAGLDTAVGSDPGELLTPDADGISAPILYKLGAPLKMGERNSGDDMQITEIEIQARTLGDIEDVLATEGTMDQAEVLLTTCAKPVGPVPLQRLPSWAVEQIALADGLFVAQEIVKRFLD